MTSSIIKIPNLILAGSCLIGMSSTTLFAQESETSNDNILDAISNGQSYLDLRLRNEFVDQDGFADNANATTLRTKLGYTTANFKGFSANLEFEHSAEILGGNYNNGNNGNVGFPAIIDANHTEVNQAKLMYTGIKGTTIIGGRQGINFNTQRFVGTVGWRQNDQTFDSITVVNNSIKKLNATYSYVWNVNRIFGNDNPLGDLKGKTHFINFNYKGLDILNIEGYGYLLDFDNVAVKGLNSKTFGIRANGSKDITDSVKVLYVAEFANQTEYQDNPINFSVDFFNVEAGLSLNGFTIKGGIENLGSDGGAIAFKTPLATLHKFNGWADLFLNTPTSGLRDFYGSASYLVANSGSGLDGTNFTVVYHKFKSDLGNIDYGSEINASISKKIFNQFSVLLKYANYKAENFASDRSVLWLQIGTKL